MTAYLAQTLGRIVCGQSNHIFSSYSSFLMNKYNCWVIVSSDDQGIALILTVLQIVRIPNLQVMLLFYFNHSPCSLLELLHMHFYAGLQIPFFFSASFFIFF